MHIFEPFAVRWNMISRAHSGVRML